MSLTSYRAAPPRDTKDIIRAFFCGRFIIGLLYSIFYFYVFLNPLRRLFYALSRPGGDLLSRALRQSTISAGAFHGRVRDGIGCVHSAITTKSAKSIETERSWDFSVYFSCFGLNE